MWPPTPPATTREKLSTRVCQRDSRRTWRTGELQTRLVLWSAHGSLLTEGTKGTIFEITDDPVLSVEGRKIQSIVFMDPGSIMNFITRELAYNLHLAYCCTLIPFSQTEMTTV